MANNAAETTIGALVLAAAIGFVVYAGQASGIAGGSAGVYPLRANFGSAEGVNVGTDIRLAGISIGSVSALDLNKETYQAESMLSIRTDVKIPEDSDVKIASEGLLGGSFIEIEPGGSDVMLSEGDEILLTQSAVSLLNLLIKFAAGGGDTAE